MTAEKHPLQKVRAALERGTYLAQEIGDTLAFNQIDHALTTLTTYMGQTQSCAECERLARENDAMKSTLIAMRELNKRGLVEENKALREAVRDFGAVCGGVDDWGDKLAAVQEKHAATIAAAGGE